MSDNPSPPLLARGERVAPHLTVVGLLDGGGSDPVYIVWHRDAWCAMCCKLFKHPIQARWEAEALASLAHPGIVRLLEDGSPRYILTEFLQGPSLARLLDARPKGRLALSDALRVAVHLGSALAHLHGRGLVHLDVKPANVIVTRRRPVLFDLGTARRLDGQPLGSPEGTDDYMPPEQCRGEVPSPASDVWALGVTLFEMLTGALPFPDGDAAEPFPQLHVAPHSLREFLPRAPQALERLLDRCLAPDPADRPSSLGELLPALNDLIRTGPRMWPDDLDPRRQAATSDAAPAFVAGPNDRQAPRRGVDAGREVGSSRASAATPATSRTKRRSSGLVRGHRGSPSRGDVACRDKDLDRKARHAVGEDNGMARATRVAAEF